MTKEEIAEHIAKEFGSTKANKEQSIYRACIRMAGEIGAEYTEEMRKLNEEWEENLEIQRKMLIERAIDWLNQNTDWDNIYSEGELQELFRKAMEEKK